MLFYLSLGSNVGDRRKWLRSGIEEIRKLPETTVDRCSSIYETEPWGKSDQRSFLNVVVEGHTSLDAETIFAGLRAAERRLGRVRGEKWGPRTIDIDILIFGSREIHSKDLTIPHPQLRLRRFVLEPLREIAADLLVPGTGKTVADLTESCPDTAAVSRL